jgi:molybdenum cofactor cytidylyltransferase
MGAPKATLRLPDGRTFLSCIVSTLFAAGADDVVVVVGHDASTVVEEMARSGLPGRSVENPAYETGQLSSLLAGLNVVDRPGVVAALVALVDVPFVSPATVRAVVERFWLTRAPVVRPTSRGRHGHPVLVARPLFHELRRADPAPGAKPVIHAHSSSEGDVEVTDEGAFVDIDTRAEYESAIASFGPAPNRRPDHNA